MHLYLFHIKQTYIDNYIKFFKASAFSSKNNFNKNIIEYIYIYSEYNFIIFLTINFSLHFIIF